MTEEPQNTIPLEPFKETGDINIIKIPLLVSGILNALTAAGTIVFGLLSIVVIIGCFILPVGLFFAFLAWWEIRAYMRLNDPNYPNDQLKAHIKTIAILEIVAILFGSVSSLICGILVMTNIDNLDPLQKE